MRGQPVLWIDRWVYLAANQEFQLPIDFAILFGNAQGVLFTAQYAAVGPGAAAAGFKYLRSAALTSEEMAFEAMNATAIPFTRGVGSVSRAFGADGTGGDKYPRGLGSLKVIGSPADWTAIHLRIWYAAQA